MPKSLVMVTFVSYGPNNDEDVHQYCVNTVAYINYIEHF